MSTKVYTAYKLKKPSKFESWIKEVVPKAKDEAKKAIEQVFIDGFSYEKMEQAESSFNYFSNLIHEVTQQYKQVSIQWERNPFNFTVEIAIYLHDGEYYVIPYGDMYVRDVLNFLKEDENLTDFAYWNNTDKPDDKSQQEWDARGEIWHDIFGWNDERIKTPPLILNIVIPDNFHEIYSIVDINELIDALKGKKLLDENFDIYEDDEE
jgi:hypothetical protein